ncbi:MAG: L,D-transpeptidase family protein [Candidatus Sumerlaeaceae bacterium]
MRLKKLSQVFVCLLVIITTCAIQAQEADQPAKTPPAGFGIFKLKKSPFGAKVTRRAPSMTLRTDQVSQDEQTPDQSQQWPAPKVDVRVEEIIPPDEKPGPRAATAVAAPGAGGLSAANRKINFPRDPEDDLDVLKLQIFLDYHGYSVGEIDGRWGYNTGRALYVYQMNNGLPTTGQLDDAMLNRLEEFAQVGYLVEYTLTADDVKGPFYEIPRDYHAMAKYKWLPYESLGEKLAEKFHCSQSLLRKLNPGVDIDELSAGETILAPNVLDGIDEKRGDVAVIRVSKHNKWTMAFDVQGRFMFYYPSTLGSEYDPLPLGTYQVTSVIFYPPFKYQPKLFWDADPNEPEEMLPPGPNSPVGKVWIGTSRKSVGIHGTPNPENISRNTSHGCIRLTNWDAEQLAKRVKPGTRIEFVE